MTDPQTIYLFLYLISIFLILHDNKTIQLFGILCCFFVGYSAWQDFTTVYATSDTFIYTTYIICIGGASRLISNFF